MMDMKNELRKKIKNELRAIDATALEAAGQAIHETLFQSQEWRDAKTIAVTVSTKGEIDTRAIIKAAWLDDKVVAVPKCVPSDKRLGFRELGGFDQLESVYYGLQEPIVDQTRPVDKAELDLIIVPGVLFDDRGYRIGFGGGYYDRFLAGCDVMKLAQALDCQLIPKVPYEVHDVPIDRLITPTRSIQCSKSPLS